MFNSICPLKEAARDCPSLPFWIDHETELNFFEMDSLTEKMEKLLTEREVSEGDLICHTLPPSPNLLALLFATFRKNASLCPLNLRLPAPEISRILKTLKPKLYFSSLDFKKPPLQNANKVKPKSLLLFTSGSSSSPKLASLSFQSLLMNASFSVPLTKEDAWALSLPLFHVGGIGIVLRCVLNRARLIMDPEHPKITHLSYVPTQLHRKNEFPPNLKCILLGGQPIGHIPKNLPIFATYGLTEMGSSVLIQKNPTQKSGNLFLGKALQGREIRLNQDGEILVRGDTLFDGYLKEGKLSRSLEDGWFKTGDLGEFDPHLGFAITGRKDFQFISGGENIQPEEIESLLFSLLNLEGIVIPKKDPEFGMKPTLLVEKSSSFDLPSIQDALKDHLPKYKIPTKLEKIEILPRMGLKLDRKKLLEEFSN